MSTVTNVAAGKPKIGGAVYAAPVGTTLPTDATTALAAAFKNLGYVSEDGLKNALDVEIETVKAWGGDEVLITNNGKTDTFSYTLLEVLNPDVLKHVYGSANVTGDTLASGIALKVNNGDTEDVAMVFELILRGALKRIVVPRAHVTEVGEITYADSNAVGYETTITCQADAEGNSHYEYIQNAPAATSGGGGG